MRIIIYILSMFFVNQLCAQAYEFHNYEYDEEYDELEDPEEIVEFESSENCENEIGNDTEIEFIYLRATTHGKPVSNSKIRQMGKNLRENTPRSRRKMFKKTEKRTCVKCNAVETPQWRVGPDGRCSLCNACGLRFSNGKKREAKIPQSDQSIRIKIENLLNP